MLNAISLSAPEAVCLEAIRSKTADISIAPATRGRGRPPLAAGVLGASAARMVTLLSQPRRGSELATSLGVTRQRVHQLVVALSERGVIRSADPNYPTFVVALKDDPSILLTLDQERALSAFPEAKATTLSKILVLTQRTGGKIATTVKSLLDAGLIEKTGTTTRGDLYRLTAEGLAHWQRSMTARRADVPPLPFRSDRVFGVLSFLATRGPTRTRDIGYALGISQTSMNALMQHLKRKRMVRIQSDAHHAPYELTQVGRETLAAKEAETCLRAGPLKGP